MNHVINERLCGDGSIRISILGDQQTQPAALAVLDVRTNVWGRTGYFQAADSTAADNIVRRVSTWTDCQWFLLVALLSLCMHLSSQSFQGPRYATHCMTNLPQRAVESRRQDVVQHPRKVKQANLWQEMA